MGQSRFQYKEITCSRSDRLALLNQYGSGGWNYCSEYVEIDDQWAEDIETVTILMKLEIKAC